MNIEEQKSLFAPCSDICQEDAFEILEADGVDTIPWDDALDKAYGQWIYMNIE